MGTFYTLVNHSKKAAVSFWTFAGLKKGEILSHPVACALTTAYLFDHTGDRIAFVPDDVEPLWPFPDGSPDDLPGYEDVTDRCVAALIGSGLVRDDGVLVLDPQYPEVRLRQLVFLADLPATSTCPTTAGGGRGGCRRSGCRRRPSRGAAAPTHHVGIGRNSLP